MINLSKTSFDIRNPKYGKEGQVTSSSIDETMKMFKAMNGSEQGFKIFRVIEKTTITEEEITPTETVFLD